MGDRALVIFHDDTTVSPVIYLHWSGSEVPQLAAAHEKLMADRKGDVQYAAARFVGLAHEQISGNLSLGIWNADADLQAAVLQITADPTSKAAASVLASESHGDAGVCVIDCRDFTWKAFGGYLNSAETDEADD